MTNNTMLVGVLVDRSGSMSSCRSDMEGGLATFLAKQAEVGGKTQVTLAQFDTDYDIVYPPTPIADVPPYHLVPRGMTALLDAMGRFITETGAALAAQKEHKRPGKVLISIITDGLENSSHEWTRERVKELVEQQRNVYDWEFVFLGANMDAVAEGASFGMQRGSSMTFDTANVRSTMDSLSSYAVAYASAAPGASVSFSEEDREQALKDSSST